MDSGLMHRHHCNVPITIIRTFIRNCFVQSSRFYVCVCANTACAVCTRIHTICFFLQFFMVAFAFIFFFNTQLGYTGSFQYFHPFFTQITVHPCTVLPPPLPSHDVEFLGFCSSRQRLSQCCTIDEWFLRTLLYFNCIGTGFFFVSISFGWTWTFKVFLIN